MQTRMARSRSAVNLVDKENAAVVSRARVKAAALGDAGARKTGQVALGKRTALKESGIQQVVRSNRVEPNKIGKSRVKGKDKPLSNPATEQIIEEVAQAKRSSSPAPVTAKADPQQKPEPRRSRRLSKRPVEFPAEDVKAAKELENEQENKRQIVEDCNYDDLDAADFDDPAMVAEYVKEIFQYIRWNEKKVQPAADYITIHNELTWRMRAILVEWIVEVHSKFRLLPETLYLAVNIIDRFLSKRPVSIQKLQLVGITSIFIAAKFEEVTAPSITSFTYMVDGGYSEDEILKAERYILNVLEWDITTYTSPMGFLRRCSKADDYDIQSRTLAKYLIEQTLVDHRFLEYTPSKIAAASLMLARIMLRRHDGWGNNLTYYSGYKESELSPVVATIVDSLANENSEIIRKKYGHRKYMKASIFVEDWIKKNADSYSL